MRNHFLTKNGIIEDIFEYQRSLDPDKLSTYAYIVDRFQSLFQDYANAFALNNCGFRIKSDILCNASALKIADYNSTFAP